MKFINREAEFLGKKKIIKVDKDNVPLPGELPILVRIERDDAPVYEAGTPINAENLNKGNWRDDDSLSFIKRNNNELPERKVNETQIITKSNGETWIVPPLGLGNAECISDEINKEYVDAKVSDITPRIHTGRSVTWSSDSGEYPQKGTIAISGVTSDMVPIVSFSKSDAVSGNFSAYCESYDGGIYIWAKTAPPEPWNVHNIVLIRGG